MCLPLVAAIPIALTVASTAATVAAQAAAANAQGEAAASAAAENNRRFKQLTKSARANYTRNLAVLGERTQQERFATVDQATQVAIDTARGKSTATAAAATRGVRGKSVNALLDEFEQTAGRNYLTLGTNLDWVRRQHYEQARGLRAETEDAIRSNRPQPVLGPSPAALALNIGSTLLSGASTGYEQYQRYCPGGNC